jgi:hypothetical protein
MRQSSTASNRHTSFSRVGDACRNSLWELLDETSTEIDAVPGDAARDQDWLWRRSADAAALALARFQAEWTPIFEIGAQYCRSRL